MIFLRFIVALALVACHVHGMRRRYEMEWRPEPNMEFRTTCEVEGPLGGTQVHSFKKCDSGPECNFKGVISRGESFCRGCEINMYPERFVACSFCRVPGKKESKDVIARCCSLCKYTIAEMLVKGVQVNNDKHHIWALKVGVLRYLNQCTGTMARKYISAFGAWDVLFDAKQNIDQQRKAAGQDNSKGMTRRFGRYAGAMRLKNGNTMHAWTDSFNIHPRDKKHIVDEDRAEAYIKAIAQKYNLVGPETGEIMLDAIPAGAITYEEEVAKK